MRGGTHNNKTVKTAMDAQYPTRRPNETIGTDAGGRPTLPSVSSVSNGAVSALIDILSAQGPLTRRVSVTAVTVRARTPTACRPEHPNLLVGYEYLAS